MLHALDMRTVLFEGALVCFTIAGIMAYHSIARKTYPGFHSWTIGFACSGAGAMLIALRGLLPDFLSIVLANVLIAAMPFLLAWGLAVFLEARRRALRLHGALLALLLGVMVWATYVFPNLCVRVLVFSAVYFVFFASALYVAVRRLPEKLGGQNWLLVVMIFLALLTTGLRLALAVSQGKECTFLRNAGDWQCVLILMTVLSMVGIMASLIILNAQRMELELKEANRKIETLANQDGLTQLFNRRYFDKALLKEFNRLQRHAQPLSLVMGDIDFFKNFNDTYGHQAGDDCICAIATVFRQAAGRAADIAARYGGEEFVLLLPETDLPGARKVAQAISRLVREKDIPHATSAAAAVVTLSLGVATVIPDRSMPPDMLLKLADTALYESKSHGRNRISG